MMRIRLPLADVASRKSRELRGTDETESLEAPGCTA